MTRHLLLSSPAPRAFRNRRHRTMAARKYFVGSYATSPNLYSLEHPPQAMEPGREAAFYKGLAALDLCGPS